MNKVKKYNIRIIIPVFNDNISLNILIKNIYDQANKYDYFFEILIIDDNSNKEIFIKSASSYKDRLHINILKNKQNLGHQKAIFMGLNYTLTNPIDKIIVMDSDGEDNPSYIHKLIEKNSQIKSNIVAKRIKRKESFIFILFYSIYKLIFSILTGYNLNFGNFSIINFNFVQKILNVENNFNHFSASLLKVDKNIYKIPIPKNNRYEGKSKMSFFKLITHGLDAISIFRKEAIIRVILFSIISEIILLLIALIIFYLRFFSNLLITGQTTTILFFLIVIGFVFIVLCLMLSLSLNSNINPDINNKLYKNYLNKIQKVI